MNYRRFATALFVLLVALLPLLARSEYWLMQASYIGLYAMATLGLVLLTGIGGLTSLGQAAFVGIGAYSAAYLAVVHDAPAWFSLFTGLAITAASAFLIGFVTLRMSGHYLPLATIAWGLSIFLVFGNLELLGKFDGFTGIPTASVLGVELNSVDRLYYLIWAILLGAIWGMNNLLDSRPGRAIRALKGGATMAEAMGINTAQYKTAIFVLAALLASVSGWLLAFLQRTVNPSPFSLKMGIEYLIMAVVGGAGHAWGAILGAGILKVAEDQFQTLLPKLIGAEGNFEIVVFGMLLIVLLKYARDGLFPFLLALIPANSSKMAPPSAARLPRRASLPPGEVVLDVNSATKTFGGLVAVNEVSFKVRSQEIVGLIGPNGAGKSTTFNLVTGLLRASSGSISFLGEAINGLNSRDILKRGVARTFQHVKLIPNMTVLENVAMGAHTRGRSNILRAIARLDRAEEARLMHEAALSLERVGMGKQLFELAGNLSLGQQRILEIARALCSDPYLLLLDEPAAGLRHLEKKALAGVLKQLRDEGMSILLVEHDMDFVMGLTDHIVVMEFGSKIAEGTPRAVQQDAVVLAAYLGGIE